VFAGRAALYAVRLKCLRLRGQLNVPTNVQ